MENNEQKFINVDAEYLKSIEEQASQAEYLRGVVNGMESVLSTFVEIFKSIGIKGKE